MGGKRQVFTDKENEVLRAALRRFRDNNKLTQEEVGEVLGVKQQNAGRLLSAAKTGMSREAANRFTRKIGFLDVEHFLIENEVFSGLEDIPTGPSWLIRDTAISIARKVGHPEEAIQAVVARFTVPDDRARPLKWWMTQIALEALAQAPMPPTLDTPASVTPPPSTASVVPKSTGGVRAKKQSSKKRPHKKAAS